MSSVRFEAGDSDPNIKPNPNLDINQPSFQAGDALIWDSRLPHATGAELLGTDTREVAYST